MNSKYRHIMPEIIQHFQENASVSLAAACFGASSEAIAVMIKQYYEAKMIARANYHIAEMADYNFVVCSKFGCGKHLTLQEQRFGTVCINHSRRNILNKEKE